MAALPGVETPREVRLIGGVSRNRLFLSIKANVMGRPITVVEEPEATALGAALLGGIAAASSRRSTRRLPDSSGPNSSSNRTQQPQRYETLRSDGIRGTAC